LDAIEKAGNEGLSLEQVAQSLGNHVEQADAIVEALQSFNCVKKVNAFDHIRVIAYSRSAKYFLHISSSSYGDSSKPVDGNSNGIASEQNKGKGIQNSYLQENQGFCRRSIIPSISIDIRKDMSMTVGDGHRVTILEMTETDKADLEACRQCDPPGAAATQNIDNCSEQLKNISNFPSQNLILGQETGQSEHDLTADSDIQFLPIYPWLTADGQTNTTMLKALTRRVVGVVMQQPGILEDDLIKQLDILNPQTARKLLQLLELDNHLHVRTMYQSSSSPPGILKGVIGANFEKQKPVWRKHYYANPMSTTIL